MGFLDTLEVARRGPFRFRHNGETYTIVSPEAMHFQKLLAVLRDEHVPGTPRMPFWKRTLLFERWVAHHDLPSFLQAQRLCYLLDPYYDALEVDLRTLAAVDLRALWLSRDWRSLLNAIDHLPADCWYSEQVANDPEHAEMIAEVLAKQGEGAEPARAAGPPLRTWSPQMAAIADLYDAIRELTLAVIASGGSKTLPKFDPYKRPTSLLDAAQRQAEYRRRQSKHESLAMRLLPHKRPPEAEPKA